MLCVVYDSDDDGYNFLTLLVSLDFVYDPHLFTMETPFRKRKLAEILSPSSLRVFPKVWNV